ncbi:MAG: hypothetical protein ABI573_08610 [Chloroflexota bacterium]
MFATLLGAISRPNGPDGQPTADDDAAIVAVLAAQADAGLEPLTDGRLRASGSFWEPSRDVAVVVDAWRFAAGHTDRVVKQALPGPYTLGRRAATEDRDASTIAWARLLREQVSALVEAGCQLIEIDERDAHLIGEEPDERRRFADAHLTMVEGIGGVHLSLAITGGNADTAGIETILAAPYASLAVNLIDGPDNWRLVTSTPGDRGIICGVVSAQSSSDDGPELMLWAASYASASQGRGPSRVGLGTACGLDELPWEVAERKMRAVGEAARLAQLPVSESAPHLDPRSIDIKSAAMGRYVPRSGRRRQRPLP